jgi:hypothetical protein
MEQEWKVIDEFPEYEISNDGFLRNKSGKILKQFQNSNGYLSFRFWTGFKTITKEVHRFVAKAFIPNTLNKTSVDHIDRNKTNNQVNNLRWATRTEQTINTKKRVGTTSKYRGVSYQKDRNKWRCKITFKGNVYIRFFETEEEAGLHYHNKAIELFGDFYKPTEDILNLINET